MYPTPCFYVNEVLEYFKTRIQAVLGSRFLGMYLYGSLALGDFDPQHSDIDFCVVTDADVGEDIFDELKKMHADFDRSGLPYACKVDAAYLPRGALNHSGPTQALYPQIEWEHSLAWDRLELGWAFQRHTLRRHGVTVAGPDPAVFIEPVKAEEMRAAALAIAGRWLEQARDDPGWLEWVRGRQAQSFVVLTLCRMLYSLDSGDVVSKPNAARWAQAALGQPWADLIERALEGRREEGQISDHEMHVTLALIQYTADRCQT